MNRLSNIAGALAISSLLGGCVAATPSAGGASVRAILASQALPAQPRPDTGADAGAAVAAYVNYQRSYAAPVSQTDTLTFGSK
ncbi:hypothetical protein [Massilia sp. Leaf139]|uniref:hypothetical protein n=1 Tax=Massilia sp. Leaf139 TaxID=1736272 RepID=UPI0006FB49A9|nr:hypothetical protein [Massilia sp. Leaf139]KQQ96247.1 hypothetical protein ASF77_21205 [Massilia sp. Leaf139]